MKIAFIGTGVMGAPMAGHLAKAGHDVTVYNRTAAKAAATGLAVADTPAAAARDKHAVITCVGNDEDLAAVTLGDDGAFAAMREDAVFIDHTTVSAAIARRLAEQRTLSIDAPVSGGQAGAEKGRARDHVRRLGGSDGEGRADHGGLCRADRPRRRARRRADDQDGQSDRDRREYCRG